tara:strand:+ start:162 stop:1631 length:1470 start_codon:yes stop_codon:yes gene_type:complete
LEGGDGLSGLNANALAKFNQQNRNNINNSDAGNSSYAGSEPPLEKKMTRSKLSDETHIEGLEQFNKYGELFQDLTLRTFIDTEMDVVQVIITYDSKKCVAIINDKDEHFEVVGYSLTKHNQIFRRVYDGTYIKMNNIEQSDDGTIYAIAYQDNGQFYVNVIDDTGKEHDLLDVSQLLHLDAQSKPITGFWEPLITAVFIPGGDLFINAYHRLQKKSYHFTYSYKTQKALCQPMINEIKDCTPLNFPIKSFYSQHSGDCYTFYRQGHCVTVNTQNPDQIKTEKITTDDLGTMYLLFDQALVTRSSSSILFFKIDEETGEWKKFHTLPKTRGQIYFIRGNIRIQVTTDEKVYFYLIDKETFMPRLENCMNNFMQCSQMMFGTRVRYGITFKANQPGIHVYTRKYYHNFKVAITNKNFEGAVGSNLTSMNAYVMAEKTQIGIYDQHNFNLKQTWSIPTKTQLNSDIEILFMTVSADEQRIGVALGRKLIKDK